MKQHHEERRQWDFERRKRLKGKVVGSFQRVFPGNECLSFLKGGYKRLGITGDRAGCEFGNVCLF